MSYAEIGRLLFISGESVRQHIEDYAESEKLTCNNGGSSSLSSAGSITSFFVHLLKVIPLGTVNIILDNAGYHTGCEVADWLALHPRIKLHFLPPYSPNLNAIERIWKIMHQHTTNNQYHATFKQFTESIRKFPGVTFAEKAKNRTNTLTDNFIVSGAVKV